VAEAVGRRRAHHPGRDRRHLRRADPENAAEGEGPGCDFTLALLEKMQAAERSVFLLGARPGVAEQAAERLRAQFPRLRFVGTNDGYFQNDGPVIEKINAAAPDLLLVCLGAPKQEKWMHANAAELDVGLMIGAGGSLDV
jgi:N-acetylglucosaminyldiphosphoundecaprenol N-acetyl-beta-D-mannosaminyltransferase